MAGRFRQRLGLLPASPQRSDHEQGAAQQGHGGGFRYVSAFAERTVADDAEIVGIQGAADTAVDRERVSKIANFQNTGARGKVWLGGSGEEGRAEIGLGESRARVSLPNSSSALCTAKSPELIDSTSGDCRRRQILVTRH